MIDSMEQEDFDIRNQQPVTSRERDFENALRPLNFEDFSGQDKVVDNLRIFVKAARLRGEALDHVFFPIREGREATHGPAPRHAGGQLSQICVDCPPPCPAR